MAVPHDAAGAPPCGLHSTLPAAMLPLAAPHQPSPLAPPADEHFRLVYDAKGRFVVHRITKEEASYKLCKVRRLAATRRLCSVVGQQRAGRVRRAPSATAASLRQL